MFSTPDLELRPPADVGPDLLRFLLCVPPNFITIAAVIKHSVGHPKAAQEKY
jgi:hypothetical protein